MLCSCIGLGIDGDGLYAHLLEGLDDSYGDLTKVGDWDLLKSLQAGILAACCFYSLYLAGWRSCWSGAVLNIPTPAAIFADVRRVFDTVRLTYKPMYPVSSYELDRADPKRGCDGLYEACELRIWETPYLHLNRVSHALGTYPSQSRLFDSAGICGECIKLILGCRLGALYKCRAPRDEV